MDYTKTNKPKYADSRGYLVEFLTRIELPKNTPFGHIYFVTFSRKGIVRGNHYHKKKDEYFGIAFGKVKLVIKDISTKKRKTFILDANNSKFVRVQIGPHIAHAVQSLSTKAVLIDYFSQPYDQNNPDNHPYILIKSKK